MRCANCGAEVRNEGAVCSGCGHTLIRDSGTDTAGDAVKFTAGTILKKTFQIFSGNPVLFMLLGALSGLGYGFEFVFAEGKDPVLAIIKFGLYFVIFLFVYIIMMIIAYRKYNDRSAALTDVFGKAIDFIPVMFLMALAYNLMMTLGLVLLIVPGLYVMAAFSVSDAVYFAEKKPFFECFKESGRILKGHLFSVMGVILLLSYVLPVMQGIGVGIYSAASGAELGARASAVISFIIGIFTAPLNSIAVMVVYKQAKASLGE